MFLFQNRCFNNYCFSRKSRISSITVSVLPFWIGTGWSKRHLIYSTPFIAFQRQSFFDENLALHYFALAVVRSIAISASVCLSVRSLISETRGPIYKISYDNLTIMPKLRPTYDGRPIFEASYDYHKINLQ